jgi:hypothetical protein
MNKVPGRYWKPEPDLSTSIQQHSKILNPQPVPTHVARLILLSSEVVGGNLLVTQQFAPDGTKTEPYITVVAAPSLATLGTGDKNPPFGLSLLDFWDDTVLTPFGLPVDSHLHCPLMAAAEGVYRKIKLPGILDFMQDTQPLLFSSGELVAATVHLPMESRYRAFYLPEVCGLPLRLVWPTTIMFVDYLASIQSLKSDYQHFVQVLEALQPALISWFQAIAQDPPPFIIPSTIFLEVNNKAFPAVETGDFPDQIVDPLAFSPLQEMLHGYIWRLTCDHILAIEMQVQKFSALYLARGEMALNADSYFGAKLPGRFCPNFAYHFRVANNTRPDPLKDLTKLHMVSLWAQEFDPVIIDLHIDVHPEISLRPRTSSRPSVTGRPPCVSRASLGRPQLCWASALSQLVVSYRKPGRRSDSAGESRVPLGSLQLAANSTPQSTKETRRVIFIEDEGQDAVRNRVQAVKAIVQSKVSAIVPLLSRMYVT